MWGGGQLRVGHKLKLDKGRMDIGNISGVWKSICNGSDKGKTDEPEKSDSSPCLICNSTKETMSGDKNQRGSWSRGM